MPLASVPLDEARAELNDVGAAIFTNTVLLPFLKKSYRELQQELNDNGISYSREQAANINITAGMTALTFASTPALPTDLLYPISISEKVSGADDSTFVPMVESTWTPNLTQTSRLIYWTWREDEIKFVGATSVVPIQLRYFKSLAAIADSTTNIPILDCETFLAARTAALAAFSIGGSLSRAEALSNDADRAMDRLLGTAVKNRQQMPVRRRKFRPFGARNYYY